MKELKQFQCEICNTVYKSKDLCESCERFHCKPKQITKANFNAGQNGSLKYPQRILIEMEDGKTATYEYKGVEK
ncbi:MAG: hypothetical protein NC452_05935 [Eubacterium sp.]|nr:hypothetical protein [Eubacterium sp.]